MKLFLFIFLIISSLLGYSQNKQFYTDENVTITVILPDEWNLESENGRLRTKGPIPENVGINFNKETKSIEEIYKAYVEPLKLEMDFKLIDEGKESINGIEFIKMEYEMLNQGIIFHDFLYVTKYNGMLYSITATSTKDRYKIHADKLLKIIRSIKLK